LAALLPEALALLVCPEPDCRGPLALRAAALACDRCERRYRFEGDWPVLIPEEAQRPDPDARSETPA
jgi:uncharacterized protein YbaR (Trm112 family)